MYILTGTCNLVFQAAAGPEHTCFCLVFALKDRWQQLFFLHLCDESRSATECFKSVPKVLPVAA